MCFSARKLEAEARARELDRARVNKEQREYEEKKKKSLGGYHQEVKPSLMKYYGDPNSCMYDRKDQYNRDE